MSEPDPTPTAEPAPADHPDPRRREDRPAAGRRAIGVDVGGTGVKAAVVDLATGELVSPRIREKTPQPSTPEAVIETIVRILGRLADDGHLDPSMPAGVGLPGVVKRGRLLTAANIDKGWIDYPVQEALEERLGRPVRLINDADAAGLAEVAFGAARDVPGTVMLLTIGTGIGSALLVDGKLVDSHGVRPRPVPPQGRRAPGLRCRARATRDRLAASGPASSPSTSRCSRPGSGPT